MFNKLNPLLPPRGGRDGRQEGNDRGVKDGRSAQNARDEQDELGRELREDFRNSVRVEKFRIGEKAVYIPAGFSWKYLLKKDILSVRKCKWLIRSENGVAPWAMEAPALRLAHSGGEAILELEKEKSAQKALALLGGVTPP